MAKISNNICFQCNSKLILVSKVTEKATGSVFFQTTSIYKCSNEECQARKDKEADKRKQAQEDKEENTKKRNALRIAK